MHIGQFRVAQSKALSYAAEQPIHHIIFNELPKIRKLLFNVN